MSFQFGAMRWAELLADDELMAHARRGVAERGWTWPSGEAPDWDAIAAGVLPPEDVAEMGIPGYPPESDVATDWTVSYSGPARTLDVDYQSALDTFWEHDTETQHRLVLPFLAPEGAEHGFGFPSHGKYFGGNCFLWDGSQLAWMWSLLPAKLRRESAEVITQDADPSMDDAHRAYLWFLGFFPHMGRKALRQHMPLRVD